MKKRNRKYILLLLLTALPIVFFISINAGYTDYGTADILRILTGGGSAKENLVVLEFRMPRILLAVLIGAGFALSGCIIQGITRNPLADPGILGINAGAGIMVLLYVVLHGAASFGAVIGLPFLSLVGALAAGGLIYVLSLQKTKGVSSMRLILNGVAIQAGINSVMTMVIIKLDDSQHEFLAKWQAGSIWNANWKFVWSLLPWLTLGITYLIIKARHLDILAMGEDISFGLGVKVAKEKYRFLFTAVALAAACVAVSGSISFVGLIAPHLSRKLVGSGHRLLIPVCALTGGLLVLISDTIARVIIEPSEVPTGIVVSILGAPYFIFLLIRERKKTVH